MGMIACFQMVDNQCISQLLEKDEDELFEIIEEMQEDDASHHFLHIVVEYCACIALP